MLKRLAGVLAVASCVAVSGSAISGDSWESTSAVLAEIEITATEDGAKVFSYKNHGFLLSSAEGDGVMTCTGGGVVTEAGTMLRLACEVTDRDGDKRYLLVDRSAKDAFAQGQGFLKSAGGTGKHAGREYECHYEFSYMPKIEGLPYSPVVTANSCTGDLPAASE
jgi:hypothetical protein